MLDRLFESNIDLRCNTENDVLDSVMMSKSIQYYNDILLKAHEQRKKYNRFMKMPYDFIGRLDKDINIAPVTSVSSLKSIIYDMCLVERDGSLPLFPHERITIVSNDLKLHHIPSIDENYQKKLTKSSKKIAKKMKLSGYHIDISECYYKLFAIINGTYVSEYDADFIKFNMILNLLPYYSIRASTVANNESHTDARRMNIIIALWIYRYISRVCLNKDILLSDLNLFLNKNIDSILFTAISLR